MMTHGLMMMTGKRTMSKRESGDGEGARTYRESGERERGEGGGVGGGGGRKVRNS